MRASPTDGWPSCSASRYLRWSASLWPHARRGRSGHRDHVDDDNDHAVDDHAAAATTDYDYDNDDYATAASWVLP